MNIPPAVITLDELIAIAITVIFTVIVTVIVVVITQIRHRILIRPLPQRSLLLQTILLRYCCLHRS